MDELVYRFLLDSGFPRAAIVAELDLLPISWGGGTQASAGQTVRPDYAIIDPVTLDRLAVLVSVPALAREELDVAADMLGRYAQRFGGDRVQGFLVRIDLQASGIDERVRFYRVWPTRSLEPVFTHGFPDLDTLRTRLRLLQRADAPAIVPSVPELDEEALDLDGTGAERSKAGDVEAPHRPGPGIWLPGLALAALAIVDRWMAFSEFPLLDVEQAVLATGAAALLVWAMVMRRR